MPRIVDADARKAEILDRAFGVFAEKGFHGLTMRELARALSVSTGLLYHWFPGKEQLFEAILTRKVEQVVEDALVSAQGSRTVAQLFSWVEANKIFLQALIRVALDYHQSWPEGRSLLQTLVERLKEALMMQLEIEEKQAVQLLSELTGRLILQIFDPTLESVADI
jgi:AcrR family transcriptional regulator